MLSFHGIHQQILDDETEEIDLEGARMSAKTWTLSEKVRRSCLKYSGIWWLACRYSGAETDNQLRPQLTEVCRRQGTELEWHDDESAYWLPERDGKVSKIFCFGLRAQSKDQRYAKIRGSGFAGVWIDQAEELPEDIGTEVRALVRQPGFPHQLIFSPNPPSEDHFLADQFPETADLPGRKYYRLSIYDNRHNLDSRTIEKMEAAYPVTHAKYKSLILGMRGPNIVGTPVFDGVFERGRHIKPITMLPATPILECIDAGKHHPVWVAAQRSPLGGLNVLGGILGKRMFLEDFLPVVQRYRMEWFHVGSAQAQTCCDPPGRFRFSNTQAMKLAGLTPKSKPYANAPDVREAVIQYLAQLMRRHGDFVVNDDPNRWLMISPIVTKQTKLFSDALEGSYVWDEHYVSVENKLVRQPKTDQWLEGWMRGLENIALNFCAGLPSDTERKAAERAAREAQAEAPRQSYGEQSWMGS